MEHMVFRANGEIESVCGTHLGHNLPDASGDRYCIDLVCIAGAPLNFSNSAHAQRDLRSVATLVVPAFNHTVLLSLPAVVLIALALVAVYHVYGPGRWSSFREPLIV